MPQLTFRCAEEFRRRFAAAAKLRGMTVQGVLRDLAESWLSSPDASRNQTTTPTVAQPTSQRWHVMLDTILDHGGADDITGIQANLRWGAESVSKRRPHPKRHAG